MTARKFTGCVGCEHLEAKDWRDILKVHEFYSPADCEQNYKKLYAAAHLAGNDKAMSRLNWARQQARLEFMS